ncbi:MAG: hypothetical protein Q3998_02425 [Porphyromonas sp.]|nr:hypothetical protein [Porphyromonas sp.]
MNTKLTQTLNLILVIFLFSSCLGKGKGPDPDPRPIEPPKSLEVSSVAIREYPMVAYELPITIQEQVWNEGYLSLENTNIVDLLRPNLKMHTTFSYKRPEENKVEIRRVPNIKKPDETKPYLSALLIKEDDGLYSGYEIKFAENVDRIFHLLGHNTTEIECQDNSRPTLISNTLHDMSMTWDEDDALSGYTVTNKTQNEVFHLSSKNVLLGYKDPDSMKGVVKNIKPGLFWAIASVYGVNPSLGLHTYNALTNALEEPEFLPISMTETIQDIKTEYLYSYAWFSSTELHITRYVKGAPLLDNRNRKFVIHFNFIK